MSPNLWFNSSISMKKIQKQKQNKERSGGQGHWKDMKHFNYSHSCFSEWKIVDEIWTEGIACWINLASTI